MAKTLFRAAILLAVSLAPISLFAQSPVYSTLQTLFYNQENDFREYTMSHSVVPPLEVEGGRPSCAVSVWANNVNMYVCYGQLPAVSGTIWFNSIYNAAKSLQPNWKFKVQSAAGSFYLDAGPENCRPTTAEGPYIGQCPLHVQAVKQGGLSNVYLWMNSVSSPFLLERHPKLPPPAPTEGACDELCQELVIAFASRTTAFEELRATQKGDDFASTVVLKGANDCHVQPVAAANSREYVCHWQESSPTSADARYRDLMTRVQKLVPVNWTAREATKPDPQTGASITSWAALDPSHKQDVRLYLSGSSVGLHFTANK